MGHLHSILLVLVISSVLHKNFSKDVLHDGHNEEQTDSVQRQLKSHEHVLNTSLDSPCGQPIPGNVSPCQPFSKLQYPKCQSFPGKPQRVEVHEIYNVTNPQLSVEWDAPSIGFNDLWGFQVRIIDLTLNHPSSSCKQINKKGKQFFVSFTALNYGSNYLIQVQSMPPDGNKSTVIRQVSIPDKCSILAFRLALMQGCCQFSSVLCEVNKIMIHGIPSIAINITWKLKCNYIEQFNLVWNTDDDARCRGITNATDDKYTIILPQTCTEEQHNYTAQIYGRAQGLKTETYKFRFAVPSLSSSATATVPTSRTQPDSTDTNIIAAVVSVGTFIGILLVVLVFVYYRQKSAPVIRIMDHNLPIADIKDDHILPDSIKVLILYANCCMPCKKVVYSLWDVLNCTRLFDIHLDMLSEPKLNENPLRWYEVQVQEAARILLVTSRLMLKADLNPITDSQHTDVSDYVSIVHQLNLLRGEMSNTTDMSKFVPIYMNYNGSRQDIPRFLSMCRTYKLAPELDKIMIHLLGMSSVRKYSKRPIVEVGSNSHVFNEKRVALERAITDAEHFHKHRLSQYPNMQSNLIV